MATVTVTHASCKGNSPSGTTFGKAGTCVVEGTYAGAGSSMAWASVGTPSIVALAACSVDDLNLHFGVAAAWRTARADNSCEGQTITGTSSFADRLRSPFSCAAVV